MIIFKMLKQKLYNIKIENIWSEVPAIKYKYYQFTFDQLLIKEEIG